MRQLAVEVEDVRQLVLTAVAQSVVYHSRIVSWIHQLQNALHPAQLEGTSSASYNCTVCNFDGHDQAPG